MLLQFAKLKYMWLMQKYLVLYGGIILQQM